MNSGDLINPDTEILHHGDGEMGGAPAIIPEEVDNCCCENRTPACMIGGILDRA